MERKIIIDDEQSFMEAFKRVVNRPENLNHLSDWEFFDSWIESAIIGVYKSGRVKIAQDTTKPIINDNVVRIE